MNASEMTFGIEIETKFPAGRVEVGRYHHGIQVPWLPAGWTAEHDGSLHPVGGREGVEFVSPILRGPEGLRQALDAVRAIKAAGGIVDRECGLHIHVGFSVRRDQKTTARLVTLVSNFERAIYASTGTKSRENGTYCGTVQGLGCASRAMNHGSRFRVLNLQSSKPTVEFRAFAGSLNTHKIAAHVMTCLGMVERAIKTARCSNWTPKQLRGARATSTKGAGEMDVERMFYRLGWTKGRVFHVYGELAGEGIPTIKDCKTIIMRMARKYDARA